MNTRILIAIAAASALAACETPSAPASRADASRQPSLIVSGTVDGNSHPEVVLLVMDVANVPTFFCSGTLLSPTVLLTAGHCAGEPGEFSGMRVFAESNVLNDATFPGPGGPNTIEATAWHAHPLFTEATFLLHDVGVVVLSKPFQPAGIVYGTLSAAGQLDALKAPKQDFTTVGYGDSFDNPVKSEGGLVREFATPHLVQINTGFTGPGIMMLTNNASTGGTCFGDSGGPNYLGSSNVIAGTTSFGRNQTCGGNSGVFRLDKKDVIDFVNGFLK